MWQSACFLSALLLASIAAAQPPGGPPFGQRPDPNMIFTQLDRNADGKLTSDEIPPNIPPPLRALVSAADKNGDGAISRDEFMAALPGGGQGPGAPGAGGPAGGPGAGGGLGGPGAGHQRMPRPAQMSARDADKVFRRLDENHDGKITSSEVGEDYRQAISNLIGVADKSRDGALNKAEFKVAVKQMPEVAAQLEQADPELIFQQMDRDGDGRITAGEVPAEHQELFARLRSGDRDGDGALTRKEFNAALTAAHKRAPGDSEKPAHGKKKSDPDEEEAAPRGAPAVLPGSPPAGAAQDGTPPQGAARSGDVPPREKS